MQVYGYRHRQVEGGAVPAGERHIGPLDLRTLLVWLLSVRLSRTSSGSCGPRSELKRVEASRPVQLGQEAGEEGEGGGVSERRQLTLQ